jgi:DNA-directed RNA polymerase subunit M/transcription elongation factor TFIIS
MAELPIERTMVRELFNMICERYTGWEDLGPEKQQSMVRKMERSCYNAAIDICELEGIVPSFNEPKYVHRYSEVYSRILSNINIEDAGKSDHFIRQLIKGAIDPKMVSKLSSFELNPEPSMDIIEELNARMSQDTGTKVSNAYKCKRCGGNETTCIQQQTRASDEASTLSIECVHCKSVWRA